MSQSLPPEPRSESSKLVIFLLVAGCLMLIAGTVVLLKKRSAPPEPAPIAKPVVPQAVEAPAPLVVAPLTPPKPMKPRDAGPEVAVEKPRTGKRGKGGSASERPTGTIDAKEVSRFMNSRFSQVKACYERRLKVNPMLEGKLDLNIVLSIKGRVKSISRNQDTLRDEAMWGCVKKVIRAWEFPRPTGGRVVVAKTFNFKKKL